MSKTTATIRKIVIPTYAEAPAEKLPMFAENRVHQRFTGNPYPNAVVIRTPDFLRYLELCGNSYEFTDLY